MSALSTMRVNTMAKDVEAARAKASTRDAVVLLHRHLEDNGYGESADALAREAASALAGTTVADDISLERIFREHEEHYAAKHGAPPKLYTRESRPAGRDGRARDDDSEKTKTDVVGGAESGARGGARNGGVPSARTSTAIAPIVGSATARAASGALQAPDKDLGVVGVGAGEGAASRSRRDAASTSSRVRFADAPALGPDPDSGTPVDFGSEDLNALARVILRDVYVGSPDVRWDDVAGLAVAKKILREAVVAPFRYPALFTGLTASRGGASCCTARRARGRPCWRKPWRRSPDSRGVGGERKRKRKRKVRLLQRLGVDGGFQVPRRLGKTGARVIRARAFSRAVRGVHGRDRLFDVRARWGWRRARSLAAHEDGAAHPAGRARRREREQEHGRRRLLRRKRDE
jgi:hypothetical protein